MKSILFAFCLFVSLFKSHLSEDTVPKYPINIGTLNIQASQFIQNLTPLQNQISNLKQVNPSGCQRLKDVLRRTEDEFAKQVIRDEKNARIILTTSKLSQIDKDDYSTKLTATVKKAKEDFNDLSIKLLKEINDKCKILIDGAGDTLNEAEKQLRTVTSKQKSTADKIVESPKLFNKQMQDAYSKVENLLNI